MPALVGVTSNGTTCNFCLEFLDSMALKCGKCQCWVHLTCSALPEYYLVRLAVTQASYACQKCVQEKEMEDGKYEEQFSLLIAVLARETVIAAGGRQEDTFLDAQSTAEIGPSADEAENNSSRTIQVAASGNDSSVDAAASESPQINVNNVTDLEPQIQISKKLCKFYASKMCKYGLKGVGCSFDHPKKCIKFVNHGDRSNRGCKRGKDCSLFHPRLCWTAVNKGVCTKEGCKFHHIKGTKFCDEEIPNNQRMRFDQSDYSARPAPVKKQIRNSDSYAARIMKGRADSEQRNGLNATTDDSFLRNGDSDSNSQHFFELSQQLQLMQHQLLKLMNQRSVIPAVSKQCHCKEQCH